MRPPLLRHLPGLALLLPLLAACSLETPQLPTFEVDWAIPLGERTLDLEELIGEEEQIGVDGDGLLFLRADGELDSIVVDDFLELEMEGLSFQAEVGPLRVDAADPWESSFRLDEIYPPASGLDGFDTPVPPFGFQLGGQADDLPGIIAAAVDSGSLMISIHNGLPIPLGGVGQEIDLDLMAPGAPIPFASWRLDAAIAPLDSALGAVDLAGKVLPDSIEIRLRGGSPGSGGAAVRVNAADFIAIRAANGPLVVSSATAEIAAATFEAEDSLALPDSVQLELAEVSGGTLQLNLDNDLPLPLDVRILVDGLRAPNGASFLLEMTLPAGQSASPSLDLAGWSIVPAPGENGLRVRSELGTAGSAGAPVTIEASQGISIGLVGTTLELEEIRGIIQPERIELTPTVVDLVLPEEMPSISLEDARLSIDLRHNAGMPAAVDLWVIAEGAGGIDSTQLAFELLPSPDGSFVQQTVLFDGTNSRLPELASQLPERIRMRGGASVGDGITAGRVTRGDQLRASWSLEAPLRLTLGAQEIEVEPMNLDLGESLREHLRERVVSLELETEVTSLLPLGASVYVHFARSEAEVFSSAPTILGPLTIPAALPSARQAVTLRSVLQIAETDLPIFSEAGLWQGLRVVIPGSGGEIIELYASDSIRFSGRLLATVEIGGN